MVGYRAVLNVPREPVAYRAGLLAAERRAGGTQAGTRALSRFHLGWRCSSTRRTKIATSRAVLGRGQQRRLASSVQISTVAMARAPTAHLGRGALTRAPYGRVGCGRSTARRCCCGHRGRPGRPGGQAVLVSASRRLWLPAPVRWCVEPGSAGESPLSRPCGSAMT